MGYRRFFPLSPARRKGKLSNLEKCYKAGNLGAAWNAFAFCTANDLPLPGWLSKFVRRALASAMTGESMGRKETAVRRFKQDMIDFVRAHMVQRVKDYGVRLRKHDTDRAWPYEEASFVLKGSPAEGSADAIHKTVQRFNTRMNADPGRYIPLQDVPDLIPTFWDDYKRQLSLWSHGWGEVVKESLTHPTARETVEAALERDRTREREAEALAAEMPPWDPSWKPTEAEKAIERKEWKAFLKETRASFHQTTPPRSKVSKARQRTS